jgi:RimJ/RimL family protein N-acetyltransferase
VVGTGQRLTQRLRLVPIRQDSAGDLLCLHQDPGIAAWYAGPWTGEQARAFAVSMEEQWNANGVGKWLAYQRSSGELVGRGGLSLVELLGRSRVEVGWAVRERLWGQGYASEIARAALEVAFDERGIDEVVAFTEVHNLSSRRVMERLGMTHLQEIRRPGLVAGSDEVHDDAPFALYRIARPDPPDHR